MDPTDLADVTGYTLSVNGQARDAPAYFLFARGEEGAAAAHQRNAMSFADVRIPGLKMIVVAAGSGSGMPNTPVDEIRMGIRPRLTTSWSCRRRTRRAIVAEAIDWSGHAMAVLAPRAGMSADPGDMRERTQLTTADMGRWRDGPWRMDHGDMAGMDHGGMDHGDMAGMDHTAMDMTAGMAIRASEAADGAAEGLGGGTPPGLKVALTTDLKALVCPTPTRVRRSTRDHGDAGRQYGTLYLAAERQDLR